MSILDFTTGLFRDPNSLHSFVDDPNQALRDAGLPDATPEQVHDLLPIVAESMPADHPLQTVANSADPVSALQALDFEDLAADAHHHRHHEGQLLEKALGDPDTVSAHAQAAECKPDTDDVDVIVESIKVDKWEQIAENDKGLGDIANDPLTPEIENAPEEPADDYLGGDEPNDNHALDADLIDPDFSEAGWGKAIE